MADWLQPTIDSLKVDVLDVLKLRDLDSITLAENPTNPPLGAKRWNTTTHTFQEWLGPANGWADLVISMAGGGTGSGGEGGAFGTMAYQNSNNVNITGGTIVESSIVDGAILARVASPESITAPWTHQAEIYMNASLRIAADQPSAGLSRISISDAPTSTLPAYIQAYEPGIDSSNFIISNNYYGIDGSNSGRRNLSIGGSFLRLGRDAAEIIGIDTAGSYFPFLGMTRAMSRMNAGILVVGNATAPAELRLGGDAGGAKVSMQNSGAIHANIIAWNNTLYFDSNTFYWRYVSGSPLLMSLTPSLFNVPLNATFGGSVTAQGSFVTNHQEGLYIYGGPHARINIINTGQAAGSKGFVILNVSAHLYIIPTSDDGSSPVSGDWSYSIDINRTGMVTIGSGGLYIKRIATEYTGNQLDFGTTTPVDAGAISGIYSNVYYPAQWSRLGKTYTMSGQVDINTAATGLIHARMYLPSYIIHGLLAVKGHGVIVSTYDGETGYLNCPPNSGHADIIVMSKLVANRGFFYTITWSVP